MYIKSIVAAATIALIAGVGSVSADEITVADTAINMGTPFVLLHRIATEQMSPQELATTRGAGSFDNGSLMALGTRTVTTVLNVTTASDYPR